MIINTNDNVYIPFRDLREWCQHHISPREYFLHNAAGGYGWKIIYKGRSRGYTVEIEDEQIAVLFALSFQL